jgi:outer membrane protein TolC
MITRQKDRAGGAGSPGNGARTERRGKTVQNGTRRRLQFSALLWLGLAVATLVHAGEPLTLAEAARLARSNNPDLRGSLAGREAARQAAREATLSRLPTLELTETALRTDSPADVFGLQLMQERFSFPAFTSTDPNRPAPLENYTTEVRASLPLFTGGTLSSGIGQAARMAEAAAAVAGHTTFAVELEVARAYFGALLADRFVSLAEKARDTTARHVEKAQAYFDTGMIVESDLLQAKVQQARMEESLIRARNGAALARAGLNRAMGLAQDRRFDLAEAAAPADSSSNNSISARSTPTNSIPPDSIPTDYTASWQAAVQRRLDLRAVRAQTEASRLGVKRAQGAYWPQIGLAAKCALNDDRPFGRNGGSYTLAARVEWKVWDWGQTRARVARSRSEWAAAAESDRSAEQRIEFEVRQAWQGVEEARARIEVCRGAVGAAEKALAILDDRFQQGVARVTDVLDAETMADEARVHEAQARYDLETSIRSLYFAMGLSPIPEDKP